MSHFDDAQAGCFRLMRHIEDAPPIGTLLDCQPLATITVAIEIVVANKHHVLLFCRLSVNRRNGQGGNKNGRKKNSAREDGSPQEKSRINTSAWSDCWQMRRVASSPHLSQELS